MRTSFPPIGQLGRSSEGDEVLASRRNIQTTAWVVLSLAFGVFWILVVGAFVAAKQYYDTASLPHTATLTLEDGIVLFRDAVSSTLINAQDNLSLREGDDLLLGQGARASIALFDGSNMVLYPGAQVHLEQLNRSRFHDGFSRIALQLQKGTARFFVGPSTTAARQFSILTPHGTALLTEGDFGVEVSETGSRVSSRAGTANVTRVGRAVALNPGEKALLTKESLTGPLPEGDQLVSNGDFSKGYSDWQMLDVDEPGRPAEPGQRMLIGQKVDGRDTAAMRVARVSQKETHNETGLTQVINKDVLDYQSLRIHADIRVDDQSLSGGGYMGYEYPVMIRVRYRDASGGQIDWSHGFFFKNPENRPTPNGQEVPQGQWVSYSVDLMEVKQKPVHIISVEVLGAGHSFDGMIANVELVGK